MAKKLATALYQDGQSSSANAVTSGGVLSTAVSFDGLLAWIDDGSSFGSYSSATNASRSFAAVGGITRSDLVATNSTADATPVANIGGLNAYVDRAFNTFTLADLNVAYGNAQFGNDSVDMIVGTQNGYNKVWNATQPMQRWMGNQDSDLAKVGFKTFQFNGADVVVDKYAPANVMWGLNTDYMEFYVSDDPSFQFGFTGFKEAQNTIDVSAQSLISANLVIPNPRAFFKLYGTAI